MTIFKYQMAMPFFPEHEITTIISQFDSLLRNNEMLSQGPYVRQFENEFSKYIGCEFSVAVTNCSSALEIALRCLNLQADDEVIVPVETFVATGAAILRENLTPVLAGINPETFCLSVEEIKRLHTEHTKAVIVVYMAGFIPPEIFEIKEYCEKHNLYLIEDAAHAPGASIDGRKAGTLGDIGCFSFYPTKVITTAEGGMITTNNPEFYKLANAYRHRGRDLDSSVEEYSLLGASSRMTEFAGILGLSQLRCIDEYIGKRNNVVDYYKKYLHSAIEKKWLIFLEKPDNINHTYWRLIVRLDPQFDRDKLKAELAHCGVPIDWAYWPPLHLQPVFKKMLGTYKGMLPATEEIMEHFICLPVHPFLLESEIQDICHSIIASLKVLLDE